MKLRPPQSEILEYRAGRLAVSAVPGSGKTFTLSLLAAELIAGGQIKHETGQEVLIVTYLNSSVDTFRARIRRRLLELEHPLLGFDVRTLHSLSLEIVRHATSGVSGGSELPVVIDETRSRALLAQAVGSWLADHDDLWRRFLPQDSPRMQARWRDITERTAETLIRLAKNGRYRPPDILDRLAGKIRESPPVDDINDFGLLWMFASVYARYQDALSRQGGLDFDDLIWQAAELLENDASLAATLRQRWPYVLEDEAQDSVPLQEVLLAHLSGPEGNWVRVGDPNQAITSSFTAAHPRFFTAFLDRPDVRSLPLPNSGRSAPLIMGAANRLVNWTCDSHPVPEVRATAFRRQEILPTPPGDTQPNPPDAEASISIRVYRNREDEELPSIARLAVAYAREHPKHTVAILVPTNDAGHTLAEHLDAMNADYDNLLRGGGRVREIAAILQSLLAVLADPLDTRVLVNAYSTLREMGHPSASPENAKTKNLDAMVLSVSNPEAFLFPSEDQSLESTLPQHVASEDDIRVLIRFSEFLRSLFRLRPLPIDDLTLALAEELFGSSELESQHVREGDLAIANQLVHLLRRWQDLNPEWRLPEIAANLSETVEANRFLALNDPVDQGYEPTPARISLATQHKGKGLEWDAVFLVGIDGNWIPATLESPFLGVHDFLGGDPAAEVAAQLAYLMRGTPELFQDRNATDSAHIEVISERLRLLYVGLTRARQYLHISRSRFVGARGRERQVEPAAALGVLYRYLKKGKD